MELRDNGHWEDWDLAPTEKIVGIYGETYEWYSGKRLKSLGFILQAD
jgi:hypothetical protein